MKMLRDRKGISPVITTVILVAVGITIAIAVALWMTGLVGGFLGLERIEITDRYTIRTGEGDNVVTLVFKNTGSTSATIDRLMINDIPWSEWSDAGCEVIVRVTRADGTEEDIDFPRYGIPVDVGCTGTITITIPPNAYAGDVRLTSGVTATFKLHSATGKEYSATVVLK